MISKINKSLISWVYDREEFKSIKNLLNLKRAKEMIKSINQTSLQLITKTFHSIMSFETIIWWKKQIVSKMIRFLNFSTFEKTVSNECWFIIELKFCF